MTALTGTTPNQGFTIFSKLPPELRILVWFHSFAPRILEFHCPEDTVTDWQSDSACPAPLSTCWESRVEALAHYRVPFLSKGSGGQTRILRLNPEMDTIAVLGTCHRQSVESLMHSLAEMDPLSRPPRRLALNLNSWADLHNALRQNPNALDQAQWNRVDSIAIILYLDRLPPPGFRHGECFLTECTGMQRLVEYLTRGEVGRYMTKANVPIEVKSIKFGF